MAISSQTHTVRSTPLRMAKTMNASVRISAAPVLSARNIEGTCWEQPASSSVASVSRTAGSATFPSFTCATPTGPSTGPAPAATR